MNNFFLFKFIVYSLYSSALNSNCYKLFQLVTLLDGSPKVLFYAYINYTQTQITSNDQDTGRFKDSGLLFSLEAGWDEKIYLSLFSHAIIFPSMTGH